MKKELNELEKELKSRKRKLNNKFKKLNDLATKRDELKKLKMDIETNTDNAMLQKYIGILNEINEINNSLDEASKLYEEMVDTDTDVYEGSHIIIKLKKPYIRKSFNSEKFYKKYSASSQMYKTYVTEKEIKGNVSVILLEE